MGTGTENQISVRNRFWPVLNWNLYCDPDWGQQGRRELGWTTEVARNPAAAAARARHATARIHRCDAWGRAAVRCVKLRCHRCRRELDTITAASGDAVRATRGA